MEKILLHCCCAPCSVSCIEPLRSDGIEPVAFWYNPNIHPWKEYDVRRNCLVEYAEKVGMDLRVSELYGIRDFVRSVGSNIDKRCEYCYRCRLDESAKYASENGFSAFSSTLLASVYQNHDLIAKIANECAERHGVEFLYRDFRPGFREGNLRARDMGLYMQKYCGCIFSEEERYEKQIKKAESRFSTFLKENGHN